MTETVIINPLPALFNVTGGGSACTFGAGFAIGLSGSQTGVNYQLKRNDSNTPNTVAGTGAAINFGNQTEAGAYTVLATNINTACSTLMTGNATINKFPSILRFNPQGFGGYCAGPFPFISELFLESSETGVNYQLQRDGSNTGNAKAGTGTFINFGKHIIPGHYTVVATSVISTCSIPMNGYATVFEYPSPTSLFNVTGGGSTCTVGAGFAIGLSGSQTGVNYQLERAGFGVVSRDRIAGTGAAISFGNQTASGTYKVLAIIDKEFFCSTLMTGSATITVNPSPILFKVTGSGSYCAGGAGVEVGLTGSQNSFQYQLDLDGSKIGNPVTGTGAALNFGKQTNAGNYTIIAIGTAGSNCSYNMTGSATVTVNPLPTLFTVTSRTSSSTGGAEAEVGLSASQIGVSYQLQRNGSNTGNAVTGTGGAISFGNQSATGTYTVVATNVSTGCSNTMTGTATIL